MFPKLLAFSLCALAIAHTALATDSPSSQTPLSSDLNADAQNATVFSIIYGIPLTQYVVFANSIANKSGNVWTTNSIFHEKTLANASYHTTLLSNVDTLHSESLIDLSTRDLVATIPPLESGRFYVWPFYDVYGNNFCNLGTATNNSAGGTYRVTYRPAEPGCDMTPSDDYKGTIYMPTPYGAALLRIEVKNPADATYVGNSIQPGFTLTALPPNGVQLAPRLTEQLLNSGLSPRADLALYVMQLTARLAPFNLPEDGREIALVQANLRLAGASRGSYSQPSGVNLTLAFSTVKDVVHSVQVKKFESLGNGWAGLPSKLSGDFHDHYDVRAFVAFNGYMQLQASEALYPVYEITQTLLSNQTYRVEFFGKPQVDGFWSLTMYDANGYLVPNGLERFSLNSRDNMTYPGSGLVRDSAPDSKERFYMLLQSTSYDIAPEWQSNWLPSPAGSAPFNFILRFYGPKESLVNKEYQYPKVEKVAVNPPLPKAI
ncbi:hypothetical protein DFH09DRAFT_1285002 [Mycena vulgaris]|nr:hypothetical protein DFH09DRAFT_1285002 [Mycena vulgaris]